MNRSSIVRFGLIVIAVAALSAWAAFVSAGRVQAASGGAPWGELLKEKSNVQIQFMDGMAIGESPWYSGDVVGYDGNFITFVNKGYTERIFIPLSAIRQLEILPEGAENAAAPAAGGTQ